jgi:NAD+ diphosphatase
MCGFYAEAASRDCGPTEEMQEVRWFTAEQLRKAVLEDDIRIPPPVSIAFRLIADWYRRQCGEDLEAVRRTAGGWLARKGIK